MSKISGVGEKTEQTLNQLGIKTIGDLAKYPPKDLLKKFGKLAVWLWAIANAEEHVEVQENYVMKSIGAEHTFEVDTNDWPGIDIQLSDLIDQVYNRLMDENTAFRTITLKVRFSGFQTYTRAKSLRFATSSKEAIVEGIRALTTEFRNHPKKVRLVGVRLSGLEEEKAGKPITKGTLDSFAATRP